MVFGVPFLLPGMTGNAAFASFAGRQETAKLRRFRTFSDYEIGIFIYATISP